jgi:clathrin heavy chain
MAAAQQGLPIKFQELVQLTNVGINPQFISFASLTMESEKYICVREEVNGQVQVVIIDMATPNEPQRRPITAESAIMNPVSKVIALKAGNYLQIFNMEMKSKMKSHQLTEPVIFWKWISPSIVAMVTGAAVFHWSMEGQSEPVKVFDRHATLNDTQIINYKTSPDEKWMVLIGIKSEPGTNRIIGAMQLYSKEKNVSQPIEGHAAAFHSYTCEGASSPSTLFTFAAKTAAGSKLHVIEVQPGTRPEGAAPFGKKNSDIYFPPEAAQDFPVAMQVSNKYNTIYMVTKFGYLHLYDLESATLIYMNRISAETIFVTAAHEASGGIVGVNRKGQVLCVTVDEANIVPYICKQLSNFPLALRLAVKNNLPGAEQLFTQQFNNLMNQMDFKGAAKLAAESPQQVLRTPETIQRFQAAPAQPGQPSPILTYFGMLLEKGKLNSQESIELAKPVIQQGKQQLLQKWIGEDKLECTEELGDAIKMVDAQLALQVYLRASASVKVIQCFMEAGQFDKIMVYCQKVNYTPDWGFLLTHIVRVNPAGALEFAQKLAAAEGVTIDFAVVADVFMQHNCLQQCTSFLLDVLKGNKPEEAALQTRLLEMNLMAAPQVADAIMANEMFSHYDKPRIAMLCEKAGLVQRALEHYENIDDLKRVMSRTELITPEFLVKFFGTQPAETGIEMLHHLLRTNMRQNLQVVVQVAREYSEQLTAEKLIEMFETYNSWEGLFYYLGAVLIKTEDTAVHFKYIQAAAKVGNLQEVERVTREDNFYDAEQVRDFLKEARLPDQRPLINVCDRFDMVEDLTHFLYTNNMSKYIELYVQKVNPMKAPQVAGALLDADCSEDFVRALILSVRAMAPAEQLVEEVEKRNRLKLLQPWLEQRQNEGVQEAAVHNALMKIYIDMNNRPEEYLVSNMYYDSKVVGAYCEKRDPHLAFIAYKRGMCDAELVDVTNRHGLFKQQARYLVERQDLDLWATVLTEENEHRRQCIDAVVQNALPETKNPDVVSTTVKAFMTADLPNELIELLEKIVLQNSEFSDNRNLQNLLILTAIKADTTRVMDYINRLNNYDMPDIANIAVGSELYEEALVIFKKAELPREAAKVLIDYIKSIERATEFAERIDQEEVWVMLGKAQLGMMMVKESMISFVKATDATEYNNVIHAADQVGCYPELVEYLSMCRKKVKESHLDTSLIFAYAKSEMYAELEEFISAPNVGRIQDVAERCYAEGMYEAAKILFNSISNFSRLATCLMHLGKHQEAVDAARKANSARTWKEVNASCVKHQEFRLAQICALHIIVNPDELEELIMSYEQYGHFDEVISVMEAGLGLERAHMGIFTELGILYSKYKEDKLMEHIKLFWSRLNIRKMLKACEDNAQWEELTFLYLHYDEFDNAILSMIAHPIEAWEASKFKDTLTKVTNTEIFYKAVDYYLQQQPLLLTDLLASISQRVDHVRVVSQIRKAGHLPLVKQYLLNTQPLNIKEVNDALYELYVQDEDHEALAAGVVEFTNFDALEMAVLCKNHGLLQFRRIGAMLYRISKKWGESITLSKQDKVWDEAISTAAESGSQELAEDLLSFFVTEKLNACFSACLYTCYPLLRNDVVLELAWRNQLMDFAMPFMVQTMREITVKIDSLMEKERKKDEALAEQKKMEEEALASGYSDPSYGGGVDPNGMVVYGANMGMGYGGGYGY